MKKIMPILFLIVLLLPVSSMALNITDVGGSSSVMFGSINNDNPQPGQVNYDLMFTFSDWIFLEKEESDGQTPDPGGIGLVVTFSGTAWNSNSGTWTINSNIWDFYSDIMIVLKSGNPFPYAGYLLDGHTTSGDWSTEFIWDSDKALSHMSIYGRGLTPVPEPATMMLLGFGLIGIAGIGRKTRKS